MHAQNLVHRDIKPENIMFDKKEGLRTPKFIDFGLACQCKNQEEMDIAGTPYFIAPEIFSKTYGKEVDIWSLGVVIYLMMSGKMPFNATSQKDLFNRIKSAKFKMPNTFSENLQDLIKKMLRKMPSERITAK